MKLLETLLPFIGGTDPSIVECFFGIQFNSEQYKLESLWAQLMNDYTCTCDCGCKNTSGEYLCHDCLISLCKTAEIKKTVIA